MTLDVEHIERNFTVVEPKLEQLTTVFYHNLFTTHPELKPLFARVDIVALRRKLAAMLTLIVTNLRRMDVLASALRALGAKHDHYGAEDEHYEWVAASLLHAIETVSGEQWNDRTGRAWTAAITLVIDQMRAGSGTEGNTTDSDDIAILMEIAGNPSLSFQRDSLFTSYIEQKKTSHEMQLARSVQQSIIPAGFPDVAGYDFSATYEPAMHVGGDYYDWIMPGNDRVCFMFGDVSGKGVSQACNVVVVVVLFPL